MTNEQKDIIEKAVDRAVYKTGLPVTGEVLKAINVTRTQAKKLVHDGVLTSTDIAVGGQIIKGYYATNGIYPARMAKQEEYERARAERARLLAESIIQKAEEAAAEVEAEAKPVE